MKILLVLLLSLPLCADTGWRSYSLYSPFWYVSEDYTRERDMVWPAGYHYYYLVLGPAPLGEPGQTFPKPRSHRVPARGPQTAPKQVKQHLKSGMAGPLYR